ncbi:nuclease-related domain-containing protein [Halalkalibacter flavus]|uniref:nuclease-related domain-containing protein n=1 Tax=Halalkalibacter flavus TaxID=3090668 RepID=UPI002FCB7906
MKPRYEPLELKIMRSLRVRMNLSAKDESYYVNLDKGYQGEQKFDKWLEPLSPDRLILNDLLLECNNSLFQIDSLLITSNTIYLFEVKNYEGDFFIDADRWYSSSKIEIKNPLLQLSRNESLLRRMLQEFVFHLPIESYLIFVNPEFLLYQASLKLPIIFPAQLNRFLAKLKKSPSKINASHSKFAEQLISNHIEESPFNRLPDYEFDELEKGMSCLVCQTFYPSFPYKKYLICNSCSFREDYQTAVLRNVEEFKTLFPNSKITTNTIHEWCGSIMSKRTIRNILLKSFKIIRHSNCSYYIDKD